MKIFADLAGKTSRRFAVSFAQGCAELATVHYNDNFKGDDNSAFFLSPNIWKVYETAKAARMRGYNFYYGDNAYFGRGKYLKITRNAPQHTGEGEGDQKRFAEFNVTIKEWRKSGSHILVCPNSETFFKLNGTTFDDWYAMVKRRIHYHTDRPLKIRWKGDEPIVNDLVDCHAVIVFTSNSAVDALMAGVPTFTTAQCAASRMSLNDLSKIETPYFPEGRLEFASVLASNQWTLEEIQQGDAWKVLAP